MTRSQLASFIDHTVLKPETRAHQVETLCAEARQFGFAAVCIAPRWIPLAARLLEGSQVQVATVVGFPHGDTLSRAKADETRASIDAGAAEVDMVISIGAALDGDWQYMRDDIAAVVAAAQNRAKVKVIFENAHLDEAQKVAVYRLAQEAGADYLKTSTGFASSGATLEDVRLMRATVGPEMGVKAAGGIRDLATALAMIDAGATRLGCSASVAIVQSISE
ncbi:MAG TPA: deoxyribose-phosphate aldolase [Abditibacterium sp.]